MIDKNNSSVYPQKMVIVDDNETQPKDTYSYAKNAVLGRINSPNSIGNEPSNVLSVNLPPEEFENGNIYIGNNEFVLFTSGLQRETISKIYIYNSKTNSLRLIVNEDRLKFSLLNWIHCTFRVRNGCERTVYFTDGVNKPRVLQLDRLDNHYNKAYLSFLEQGGNPTNYLSPIWDVNSFNLLKDYTIPDIKTITPKKGGVLKNGTVEIALFYTDSDLNETPILIESKQVPLSLSISDEDFFSVKGNTNLDVDSFVGVENSNHSIEVEVDFLDERWNNWGFYIFERSGFSGEITRITKSPLYNIKTNKVLYIGNEGSLVDSASIPLSRPNIITASFIKQLDKNLLLANTTGRNVDWSEFQKCASKVAVDWVEKEIPATDVTKAGSSKSWKTYQENMTVMRGEVYPFGVFFIDDEGREYGPFHIPGNDKNAYFDISTKQCLTFGAESQEVTDYEKASHVFTQQEFDNRVVENHEVEDTAYRVGANYGRMAYYATEETYPEIKDCKSGSFWGYDYCGNPLEGKKVRYHKVPTTKISPFIKEVDPNVVNSSVEYHVTFTGNADIYSDLYITINYTVDGGATQSITFSLKVDNEIIPLDKTQITVLNSTEVFAVSSIIYSTDAAGTNVVTDTGLTETIASDPYTFISRNDNLNIVSLGVRFSNLDYPYDFIVGHRFVIGTKEDTDKRIYDKGITYKLREGKPKYVDFITHSYLTDNYSGQIDSPNWVGILTPRLLYKQEFTKPSFLSIEGMFKMQNKTLFHRFYNRRGVTGDKEIEPLIIGRLQQYTTIDNTKDVLNAKVEKTTTLGPYNSSNSIEQGKEVYNLSEALSTQVAKIDKTIYKDDEGDVNYVALVNNNIVHSNLEKIKYRPLGQFVIRGDQNTIPESVIYDGDTFITPFDIADHKLYREENTKLDKYVRIAAIVVAVAITVLTLGAGTPLLIAAIAGTVGVTATVLDLYYEAREQAGLGQLAYDQELLDFRDPSNGYIGFACEYLQGMFIESRVNVGLRQIAPGECLNYVDSVADQYKLLSFFSNKITTFDPERGGIYERDLTCPNFYYYNPDYDVKPSFKVYRTLPFTFDYCAECEDTYPNRVWYSNDSFDEQQNDNYRVFLENNYKDYPADMGPITSVEVLNDDLFVFTPRSIYLQIPNLQERLTEDLITTIGTGELLSGREKELRDDEIGSIGTKEFKSIIKLNGSIIFYSQELRDLFLLTREGVKSLGKEGVKYFLTEYGYSKSKQTFETQNGQEYPILNTSHPLGIGVVTGYDRQRERLLLTLKDTKRLYSNVETCNGSIVQFPYNLQQQEDQLINEGFELISEDNCERIWEKLNISVSETATQTNIYVFYDASSQSLTDARAAKTAIDAWETNYRLNNPNWQGNIYHYPVIAQERWLSFGSYPMTGKFNMSIPNDFRVIPLDVTGNHRYHPYTLAANNNVGDPSFDWFDLAVLHPLADLNTGETAVPINDKNVIVMSFVDESANPTSEANNFSEFYHGLYFVNDRPVFTGEPRPWYLEDFASMQTAYDFYDSFKGIAYPVVNIQGSIYKQSEIYLLHVLAAIEGRVIPINELPVNSNANGTVNLTAVSESNPYSLAEGGPGPLKNLGWTGVYTKNTPANYNSEEFNSELDNLFSITTNSIVSTERVIIKSNPIIVNNFDDCNQSWTLSFSLENNGWIGFHDYHPSEYLSDGDNIFHIKEGNSIWKQYRDEDDLNYTKFFNKEFPFVFEAVIESLGVNQTLESIMLGTECYLNEIFKKDTFNKMIAYSNNTCTGEIELVNRNITNRNSMLSSVNENGNLIYTENDFHINNFYNRLKGLDFKIFRKPNCQDLQLEWSDKLLNETSFEDKPWFNKEALRGKYIKIRLFFSIFNDRKLNVKYVSSQKLISNR